MIHKSVDTKSPLRGVKTLRLALVKCVELIIRSGPTGQSPQIETTDAWILFRKLDLELIRVIGEVHQLFTLLQGPYAFRNPKSRKACHAQQPLSQHFPTCPVFAHATTSDRFNTSRPNRRQVVLKDLLVAKRVHWIDRRCTPGGSKGGKQCDEHQETRRDDIR